MKRMIGVALAVMMSATVFCSMAQGTGGNPPPGGTPPPTREVKQWELARLMVELLGLTRFLPPNPSNADYFQILMQNNVMPADGWQADKSISRYDLARVVVLGMRQNNNIQQPENPQSWIDYLVGVGCRIDTIGAATQPLAPLVIPVGRSSYSNQTFSGDKEPTPPPSVGELQLGAIMVPIREYVKPLPATPTAPARGARI